MESINLHDWPETKKGRKAKFLTGEGRLYPVDYYLKMSRKTPRHIKREEITLFKNTENQNSLEKIMDGKRTC